MKFTFLALSALLAIAAADTTTAEASVVTSTPETECAKQCKKRLRRVIKSQVNLMSLSR